VAKEGEDGFDTLDPYFSEVFTFFSFDYNDIFINENEQPAMFIQPTKEEDLGTYKVYYTY